MDMTISISHLVRIGILIASAAGITVAMPSRSAAGTNPKPMRVSTTAELQQAIYAVVPGSTILVEPGNYTGDVYAPNLEGTAAAPIVIEAADPGQMPVFQGGTNGIYLTQSSYVHLRNIIFDAPGRA